MEGILPLIISIGVIIFLSIVRKKPAQEGEESSPWSEAWKGLEFPSETESDEPLIERKEMSDMESYGSQESIPTEYTFEEPVSLESLIPDTGAVAGSPILEHAMRLQVAQEVEEVKEVQTVAKQAQEEENRLTALFKDGFDAKSAIIYSEVMTPRYIKL